MTETTERNTGIRWFANRADRIVVSRDGSLDLKLEEGKCLKGSFDGEIRIDRDTHLRSGNKHAHSRRLVALGSDTDESVSAKAQDAARKP
jgi:hypothetical protein